MTDVEAKRALEDRLVAAELAECLLELWNLSAPRTPAALGARIGEALRIARNQKLLPERRWAGVDRPLRVE